MKKKYCTAVIVAAGKSERIGYDKTLMPIADVPVILRSITTFQNCGAVNEIIVVTKDEAREKVAALCRDNNITKLANIVAGGETRFKSVYNGVFAVSKKTSLVAVHDGARPLVSKKIIKTAVEKAAKYHAAIPAVRSKSTIKRVQKGVIQETPTREELYEAQTPQVFDIDLLKAALTTAPDSITDEASAVEALGAAVYIVEGSYLNIKITTPEDFIIAEAFLEQLADMGE